MDLELHKLIILRLYFIIIFFATRAEEVCIYKKLHHKSTAIVFGATEESICSLRTRTRGEVIPNQQSQAR